MSKVPCKPHMYAFDVAPAQTDRQTVLYELLINLINGNTEFVNILCEYRYDVFFQETPEALWTAGGS